MHSWKAAGVRAAVSRSSVWLESRTREGWKMRSVPDGGRSLACVSDDRGSQEGFLRSGVL